MDKNNYFTVKQFAQNNKESGSWPASEAAIWAVKAESPKNGFEKAFLKYKRRVLVDADKFFEILRKQNKN